MATVIDGPMTITVPGSVLEDFRSAAVAELETDFDLLAALQTSYVESIGRSFEDEARSERDVAVMEVSAQVALLEQIPPEPADAMVCAGAQDLACTLARLGQLWGWRLAEIMGDDPADLSAARVLVERLGWCVEQAAAVA